jgi:integrase
MATINFLYRSTKDKAILHLRLLYRFNNTDFVIGANTKFEVSKDYWNENHVIDKKTKKIKGTKDVDLLNKRLEVNNKLNEINKHILKAFNNANPIDVNKDWLQKQINYYYNPPLATPEIPKELINYIDYYIKNKENYPSTVLIRKIRVVQRKLERFQSFREAPILIKDINKKFKLEFSDYCENQKYSRITTQRDFAEVKTICIDARTKGLETSLELDKLSFPREKTTNIYLTIDELKAIENIDKNKLTDSLENAKDWLLISSFTAQRVSDFMRFTNDMIRTEDGESYIEFTQKKTNKIMTVPLHPKVREILNKRNGLFPYPISSQKYNDYIKTVCEIAEITQIITGSKKIETAPKSGIFRKVTKEYRKCDLVSSHIGRRSMATNFYGIIPTSLLINITGHSTEIMFLTYIGKSNKDLAKETFKYFK